jgi:CRP/FNR family transcriptional regulator
MPLDAASLERLHQSFDFLRRCAPELRRELETRSLSVRLEAGETICRQGTDCGHLALVLSGSARVLKLGESGREITLYRVGVGESCVLTASCILSRRPFPAYAVCESSVEAVLVSGPELRRWLEHSPPWRDYVFGLIASRLADVISLVEEVAFRRMDRRLAAHLIQGIDASEGRLHSTHQQIASELGTSREVVSRILKDFEALGLVELGRGSVGLLDPRGLGLRARED